MLVSHMKQIDLPSFTELGQALSKTTLKLHPSQVHGLITGLLCGNPTNSASWEELVTGGTDTKITHEALQALYEASRQSLADFLFDFELLLPSDTDELTLRAESLTLWCQGFLTGLKIAQVPIVGREASDVTEAITDMIEIAKMNFEEVVASEEDEAAYTELVEFVRMAVILIYQDLRENDYPNLTKDDSSNHLH